MLASATRLGAYQVTVVLGAGGMGEIYRALDTKLGQSVAIKVLPDAIADEKRIARLEREARVLASLNQPHIAALYGLETARPTRQGAAGAGGITSESYDRRDGSAGHRTRRAPDRELTLEVIPPVQL